MSTTTPIVAFPHLGYDPELEASACYQHPTLPPDAWFPSTQGERRVFEDDAKAVCRTCPVALRCLERALDEEASGERHGIRAGLNEAERAALVIDGAAPDDERHGTYAGSVAHYLSKNPSCQPCREAAATYRRQRRARLYLARTTTLEVNPIGSIRRIQALVRLGHSMRLIDEHMGWTWGTTSRFIVAGHKLTHRTTADRIAAVYERLCMTIPDGQYALRNRRLAERHSWPAPLAWNDIDDPTEKPRTKATRPLKTDIDPVVVQRVLAGDRMPTTRAEKLAITAAWEQSGRTLKDLEQLMGWKSDRYTVREAS